MREGILYSLLVLVSVFLGLIFAFVFRQPNIFFFATAVALIIYFGISRKVVATVTVMMIFLELIQGYDFGQLTLVFLMVALLLYLASDFFTISPLNLYRFSITKWIGYSITGAVIMGIVSALAIFIQQGFQISQNALSLVMTIAVHGGIQIFIALTLMAVLLNNRNVKERI